MCYQFDGKQLIRTLTACASFHARGRMKVGLGVGSYFPRCGVTMVYVYGL